MQTLYTFMYWFLIAVEVFLPCLLYVDIRKHKAAHTLRDKHLHERMIAINIILIIIVSVIIFLMTNYHG